MTDHIQLHRDALKLIDALMPGVKYIALQDYGALNDTCIALARAIKEAETAYAHRADTYLDRFPADQRATADRAYADGFMDGISEEANT